VVVGMGSIKAATDSSEDFWGEHCVAEEALVDRGD
jgi:hypothetical protein